MKLKINRGRTSIETYNSLNCCRIVGTSSGSEAQTERCINSSIITNLSNKISNSIIDFGSEIAKRVKNNHSITCLVEVRY